MSDKPKAEPEPLTEKQAAAEYAEWIMQSEDPNTYHIACWATATVDSLFATIDSLRARVEEQAREPTIAELRAENASLEEELADKADQFYRLEHNWSEARIEVSQLQSQLAAERERANTEHYARKDVETRYDLLRRGVNGCSEDCDPACDSFMHTETCKHVNAADWLMKAERLLEAEREAHAETKLFKGAGACLTCGAPIVCSCGCGESGPSVQQQLKDDRDAHAKTKHSETHEFRWKQNTYMLIWAFGHDFEEGRCEGDHDCAVCGKPFSDLGHK